MKKRNERIKIHGKLKSSIRRKSSEVNYSNLVNSEYLQLDLKQKYIPKFLIIQILFNLLLISLAIYFEIVYFFIIVFINFIFLWFYSFISIFKNEFRDKTKKWLWILLIIFIPISAYFYPDFKKIQILDN